MYIRRLLTSPAIRNCTRRNAHHGEHSVQTTYNDLPQPNGSWQTNYDANQRKYNGHLAMGIGVFTATIILGKAAGLLEFYNEFPERPAVIESYK